MPSHACTDLYIGSCTRIFSLVPQVQGHKSPIAAQGLDKRIRQRLPLGNQLSTDIHLHILVNRVKDQLVALLLQPNQIQLIFPHSPNGTVLRYGKCREQLCSITVAGACKPEIPHWVVATASPAACPWRESRHICNSLYCVASPFVVTISGFSSQHIRSAISSVLNEIPSMSAIPGIPPPVPLHPYRCIFQHPNLRYGPLW